jgi:anti-sigma B factor antagonist
MDLALETRSTGTRTVVVARGDLDLASYRTFKDLIDRLVVDGQVDLVLDLEEVTFLDSLGLGALVSTRRKTLAFNGSLEIVCTSPGLLQLFRLTHLDRVFTLLDRVPDDRRVAAADD